MSASSSNRPSHENVPQPDNAPPMASMSDHDDAPDETSAQPRYLSITTPTDLEELVMDGHGSHGSHDPHRSHDALDGPGEESADRG
ncbi:hypothetical protein ACX6XY_08660 [Streptomyces sp. O3]